MLKRRWVEVRCDASAVATLARELGLEPVAARVLVCRGLADPRAAERFLDPRLEDLPDPFSMKGMPEAVARLERAIALRERIALYGDYDVDGVTSTALLAGFLRAVGADVVTYVPHRLVEGYGLHEEPLRELARRGVRLLVTLDCGITSVAEVRAAAALGVDAVVVDHHTAPVALPAAVAILNPHQPGCDYPFKLLAAVGVTFCLVMALRRRLRESGRFGAERPEPNLREVLDLVALGTVADVVALTGVNRILVRWGLEELARTRRPGLRALKAVAGIGEGSAVTAGQVGFRLGPRINAAGRLDDAGRGVSLLLETRAEVAMQLAQELDRENSARQEIERAMLGEAVDMAQARVSAGARGLVLARESWHAGVVGIVAARVVERFHRPTVLVALSNGAGKGSGRSIEGFHLHDALAACAPHLTRFGGHAHAAGLAIDASALASFGAAFDAYARAHLSDDDLVPRCRIEGRLDAGDVSERAARAIARLAPFGAGHPEPLFAVEGRPRGARAVGPGGGHLKLLLPLSGARGAGAVDAIGFSMGELLPLCSGEVEAAVSIGLDAWNGVPRLQLRIRDLRAIAQRPSRRSAAGERPDGSLDSPGARGRPPLAALG